MKKILTILIFTLVSNLVLAKSDSLLFKTLRTEFKTATFDMRVKQSQQINLRLDMSPKYKDKYSSDYKATGACLLIAGLAFTTASILEGGSQYGTYKPSNNNVNTQTYVIPPFYQQQPRFTMFLVGIGFSLGGFGLMIN